MLRKAMFSFLLVIFLQVALIGSSTCAAQTDSSGPLISSALLRHAGLKADWQLKIPIKSNESVSRLFIHGENLYVLTSHNYLFCIDLKAVRVRFDLVLASKGLPISPEFYYDEKVWFMVGNKLVVVDPKLSKIAESQKLGMIGLDSAAGISRNSEYLYVCGSDNRLHVIVADDYWEKVSVTADDDSLVTSVIADNDFAVFTTETGNVIRVEKDTKKRLWQYEVLGQISAPLIRDGDWLYVSSRDSKIYKLSLQSGNMPWEAPFSTQASLVDPVIVGKNTLYQYAPGRGIYAVDKQSGRQMWRVEKGVSVMAEKGDNAYVLERPGVLTVMDNATRSHLLSVNFASVTDNVINAADSSLYISNESGRIMKVDITAAD